MSESRKLVAILVADVVGYSRLAGTDEERTLARLRGLRSDLIERNAGLPPERRPRPFFLSCEKAERMRFGPRRSSGQCQCSGAAPYVTNIRGVRARRAAQPTAPT